MVHEYKEASMVLKTSSGTVIRSVLFFSLLIIVFTCLQITTMGSVSGAEIQVAAESIIVNPITPAGEGGGGVGVESAGASAWIVFGVGLGSFMVLMTGLLWITIKIDS